MVNYPSFVKRRSSLENLKKRKQKFPDIAKDVIKISDIVLVVLDARFINETRNKEIEEYIKTHGKHIIYVINKIDLADQDKAREVIESEKLYPCVFVSCTNRMGGKILRNRIKIEASRIKNSYGRKHVGIVGYPNTGKSSLINLLAGGGSVNISSESGFTKSMQKIKLTKEVLLLDTPGVVPMKEDSNIYARALIKHAKIGIKDYTKIKEPELVVFDLMKKFPGALEKHYNIETDGDTNILIEQLGRKRNFLRKGGAIDEDRTARSILKDWQENKIKTE